MYEIAYQQVMITPAFSTATSIRKCLKPLINIRNATLTTSHHKFNKTTDEKVHHDEPFS